MSSSYWPWQEECAEGFTKGSWTFVAQAPPGAGKTRCSMLIYEQWKRDKPRNPLMVLVAPSIQIVRGWTSEMVVRGKTGVVNLDPRERTIETSKGTRALLRVDHTPPLDMKFLALTYQSLSSMSANLDAICRRRDVFVVLDEPHHTGSGADAMPWAASAEDAFPNANRIFCPTATPYRIDGRPPSFFHLTNGILDIDYHLRRVDAITEGYMLPLEFEYIDAHANWREVTLNSETPMSGRISEGMSGALRTSVFDEEYIRVKKF